LALDDCPVGLHRLQFGGEALRPDGLLGVVLASFILFLKKLADVLHSAFVGTSEGALRVGGFRRGGVVATQEEIKKLEIEVKQKIWRSKMKEGGLHQATTDHRRNVRGAFIETLETRHCYRKT
jgi:hypothetical protein